MRAFPAIPKVTLHGVKSRTGDVEWPTICLSRTARLSTAPARSAVAPTSRSRTARSRKSARSPAAPRETIDASDLIVSPGFVDPHTHYDAQICWDPLVSCTSWHGVTTVVMGNCGVGIAPCKPAAREVAAWDLVNVEAIPFEALSKGITWEWESFPEFLAAAERRGAGINLGVSRAADSVSALRAGRRVDGARGDARGNGAGRGAAARGG